MTAIYIKVYKFIYNKNDVYIKYSKKGVSVRIPNFIVFCVVSFPTFYYALLLIWAAIDKKFDLKLISTSLAGAIGILQVTIAYNFIGNEN